MPFLDLPLLFNISIRMIISNLSVLIFNVLFYRTINAGKTPNKNEDQSVAGMFCLNVSKSSGEADDEGSPTRLGLKVPHLTQCFPYQVVTGKIYHLILEQHF